MAKELKAYFSSVFTKEDLQKIPISDEIFTELREEMLTDFKISEELIAKKLLKLGVDKSPGIDELHPKFLKEIRFEISEPLSHIFNNSLNMGEVPRNWRDAI